MVGEEAAAAAAASAAAAKAKEEEEAAANAARAKEEEEAAAAAKAKEEEAKAKEEAEAKSKAEAEAEAEAEAKETKTASPPTIVIDTKQSVSFSQDHVMFDSNTLENNEIHDIPFAEAELREDEEEEADSLKITDEILPMDADEIL